MPDNIGSQADVAVTDSAANATLTAALKGLLSLLAAPLRVDATGEGDVPITLDSEIVSTKPFAAIAETGLATLVGADAQVDQYDYGASVAIALGGTYSGEILAAAFFSTETGAGAIQRPAGKLLILDADPAVVAGAVALGVAVWPTLIGYVDVDVGDWTATDASGAAAYVGNQPVAFHALATLYLVWFHEAATSFNDAAGDDEAMRVNLWYRRDS